jgi:glycosidase
MTLYPFSLTARQRFDIQSARVRENSPAWRIASAVNATRDLEASPQQSVQAGVLLSANLLDEIFAHLLNQYRMTVTERVWQDAEASLRQSVGETEWEMFHQSFQEKFGAASLAPDALEYLIRLHLCNVNSALTALRELSDDRVLPQTSYQAVLAQLRQYFAGQPTFGPASQTLFELLFAPLLACPDSLEAQLRFLHAQWGELIAPFTDRLLLALDVLAEENKPVFHGPGPTHVLDYKRAVGMEEYEAFSPDQDWMPRVVLLAKNTYVWLDQLSKKYQRHIYRLDQVPDEELDEMAARGFTSLWLIGVWQRSQASQHIKQLCGNPDAVASAYSLHAYDIAWELGGDEAIEALRKRAARRGIRLASDMVPNHMAIDSRWVVEHPDWFLSLPASPYPQYSFEGPNLSQDERCSIFLENHYYSKSDAAVVFRRVDNATGEDRFIYHGNDGTTMPWNDTAQLDYLNAEVREAVMQTILHVARQFPVIRFDAAMTLAKRHYHRLWFPAPGEGGAIPTRAGRGLTADEFDAVMPQEFWREVVDRVAREVPETLLLAEAFWLMEGYFVRTLGMHRVYNSAFMNMLREEKNAEYRLTLKNTLEFDPEILGRFVNFMNNPDEDTAVEQFGKGDKYFGICTLLATLPGLPMFGHGQIEGYAEKYGMEYPRAYWDEQPDEDLLARHEREIFPLLHHRALFASSENFTLFDFWTDVHSVNEDVFAYSNRVGQERALVVYHNRYAESAGWIRTSVSYAAKGAGGEKSLKQSTLGEALGLPAHDDLWWVFRDNTSGLEYLRSSSELCERGLFVQLAAYGCHVFWDWREVHDSAGNYRQLADKLEGRGVPSVEKALREQVLEPVHVAFRQVADATLWTQLVEWSARSGRKPARTPFDEMEKRLVVFGKAASEFYGLVSAPAEFGSAARSALERALKPPKLGRSKAARAQAEKLTTPFARGVLLVWSLSTSLGQLQQDSDTDASRADVARQRFDDWLLESPCLQALGEFGLCEDEANRAVALARVLTAHAAQQDTFDWIAGLLSDAPAQALLGLNRHNGVTWFVQEGMNEVLDWLQFAAHFENIDVPLVQIRALIPLSGYRVVKLLELAHLQSDSA